MRGLGSLLREKTFLRGSGVNLGDKEERKNWKEYPEAESPKQSEARGALLRQGLRLEVTCGAGEGKTVKGSKLCLGGQGLSPARPAQSLQKGVLEAISDLA